MEVFDILILGVEISVALAGFAGIIATFQFREDAAVRRADAMGLTIIVTYSLIAAFQCGLILILNVVGVTEAELWTVASVLSATICSYNLFSFINIMKGAVRNKKLLTTMWLLQLTTVVIIMANVFNALGIVFDRSPGPFLFGMSWGLCLSGWMFARLLLIPVWRTIYRKEAPAAESETLEAR